MRDARSAPPRRRTSRLWWRGSRPSPTWRCSWTRCASPAPGLPEDGKGVASALGRQGGGAAQGARRGARGCGGSEGGDGGAHMEFEALERTGRRGHGGRCARRRRGSRGRAAAARGILRGRGHPSWPGGRCPVGGRGRGGREGAVSRRLPRDAAGLRGQPRRGGGARAVRARPRPDPRRACPGVSRGGQRVRVLAVRGGAPPACALVLRAGGGGDGAGGGHRRPGGRPDRRLPGGPCRLRRGPTARRAPGRLHQGGRHDHARRQGGAAPHRQRHAARAGAGRDAGAVRRRRGGHGGRRDEGGGLRRQAPARHRRRRRGPLPGHGDRAEPAAQGRAAADGRVGGRPRGEGLVGPRSSVRAWPAGLEAEVEACNRDTLARLANIELEKRLVGFHSRRVLPGGAPRAHGQAGSRPGQPRARRSTTTTSRSA